MAVVRCLKKEETNEMPQNTHHKMVTKKIIGGFI